MFCVFSFFFCIASLLVSILVDIVVVMGDRQAEKAPLIIHKTFYPYGSITEAIKRSYDNLSIHRPLYQLEDLNRDTEYEKPHRTFGERCGRTLKSVRPIKCLVRSIPVLKWLPKYSIRKNILADIVSGFTVAVMHIPQGMAYGLLGNVPPVVGMYMAFFPVLVYFIFGTSRHVSIGTFAVVCLMTGKVVTEHATPIGEMDASATTPQYTNLEVATTVTFGVAIIQLIMYSFRLGIVSTLLSETLVNGFTCASAFLVSSSQLKDLFGLDIQKRRGYYSFPLTVYDAAKNITNLNPYATGVTCISCAILMIYNEIIKGFLAKRTKIQVPMELVVVVLGTVASYFGAFSTNFNITTVGQIPIGLPLPHLPVPSLLPSVIVDSFVITMVSYTVTMSMALIFARKLSYEVDSNQELLALGLSNFVGSVFSCMPVTASLSRSMLQQVVGGVTQIASIVSCCILLVILLWIGPAFESLPRCVLASVIVVALKGMLMQCTLIVKYFRLSKWDALVWMVTFFTTLFIDISIGLASGVCISLLSVFIQGFRPYSCLLGVIPNTDLYLDMKRHKKAVEIEGIKIFRYAGGLSFASRASFKELLFKRIRFDPANLLRKRTKMEESSNTPVTSTISSEMELLVKCIILDFGAVTFVDPAGVDLLRLLQGDFAKLDIAMYIANCSDRVYERFLICDKYETESRFMIFATVHDAVLYARTTSYHTKKN